MAATVIENGWHMAAMKSNLELALEYVEGNLAAWQDDSLPKHMKAQIGESLKEIRFAMGVADDLLEAVKSYLRCPSVGSDGPGSSTIVVQEFNRKAAQAAIAKAEGGTL
jgi:hypothetical protein